jgi:hypothetical protein
MPMLATTAAIQSRQSYHLYRGLLLPINRWLLISGVMRIWAALLILRSACSATLSAESKEPDLPRSNSPLFLWPSTSSSAARMRKVEARRLGVPMCDIMAGKFWPRVERAESSDRGRKARSRRPGRRRGEDEISSLDMVVAGCESFG